MKIGSSSFSVGKKLEHGNWGITQFLDVACENKRALELYQDCGFVVTGSNDYFEKQLESSKNESSLV
ncbi:hypothetical protein J2Z48_000316 [Croceifilum oryzae]|uniref:N-acetyltransferase domain-containing protein n=1 Tax=Croceifilum oryzae TaxID=1553429 RepID=A0AAJ1WRM9_9BACL|nr:hypothetical protein [Croceifilum oryzae]MDQ0416158.1 hypothetical protein [Croceifilum oryzae]